ncbi:PhaM family polyhydroxyalkanoate granule multifunctional regulatory protein [Hydrogenophaga luteola]|uniref:PhaM family polyhydroxyalkanoate granule multifunctional regulatory protein n=1 Tax=Hydrogenophaga luteola TaxID=1591122 RepID=A0ABV7W450_9BURK
MSDASGFGKFVPGFEFLQNLAGQAAGGVAEGLGKSLPQLPNLGHWVAPTFNVEDLEKRIEELKAVQFWLDQNAKALGATIQALEVQKMSLATLKAMNFNLGDVANALKVKAAETVSGFTGKVPTQFAGLEIPERTYGNTSAAPEPEAEAEAEEEAEEAPPPPPARKPRKATAPAPEAPVTATGVVDPMAWWGALSQQFQQIASTAMKDMARQGALDATRNVASGLTEQAVKTATGMAAKAGRSVGDTVGRAAGMGSAAVRAVTGGSSAPKKPATAGKSTPKARRAVAPKKVAAKKPAAQAVTAAPAQPLGAGDWPMPTAFFPGFLPTPGAAAKKSPAAKAPAAKKTAVRKTAAKKAPRRR